MNYLAHLCLSGNNEGVIIGNFIGDSLKGIKSTTYSKEIQRGIQLHRFIDHYTDHHSDFLTSKRIFSGQFDKYSGVLIDIFFDHFLAINFKFYFNTDLQHFADKCYSIILKNIEIIPPRAKDFYYYMVKNNILFEYKNPESIKMVLNGITHRINFLFPLNQSYDIFLKHYEEIGNHFNSFFPDLKIETEKCLSNS